MYVKKLNKKKKFTFLNAKERDQLHKGSSLWSRMNQ